MTTQSHNPDKLTEWGQSEGWRLLTVEERSNPLPMDTQFFSRVERDWRASGQRGEVSDSNVTYRTREPLPSQPDDDLSYYETELPKVIAGVRRGEKWEYLNAYGNWHLSGIQTPQRLLEVISKHHNRVRLAPVPVVRPWSEPADVPGPVCWLRPEPGAVESLVGAIKHSGVYVFGINQCGWRDWDKLKGAKYSTDRINWSPCVKPEGGK